MAALWQHGSESTQLTVTYLTIAAACIGLLVGAWHGLTDPALAIERVTVAFVVVATVAFLVTLYAIASTVHHYHLALSERRQATTVITKW
jgi:hypothetical protein